MSKYAEHLSSYQCLKHFVGLSIEVFKILQKTSFKEIRIKKS